MCTLLAHSTTNALQKYTFFQYPTIAKSRYFGRLLHVAYLDEILTLGHALLRSELLMQSMAGLSLAPGIHQSVRH
jgi:hypothetical protein